MFLVETRRGDPHRFERSGLTVGARDDIARSDVGDQADLELIGAQRFYQLTGKVFFAAQYAQALARTA